MNDFERALKTFAILESLKKDDVLQTKWMKEVADEWRDTELDKIAETEGGYIGLPFEPKIERDDYMKYRKYEAPAQKDYRGIHTGATFRTLKLGRSVGGRTSYQEITNDSLTIAYGSDENINFNIGVSDTFIEKQGQAMLNKITDFVEKRLNV